MPSIASPGLRHVFLRNMRLLASIGIYPHERQARQRIRINVDLAVTDTGHAGPDRLDRVVSYETVAQAIRAIVAAGHVNLVETLAERIAAACLHDGRVRTARVRVEKLDVFDDTEAAGVEVERQATSDAQAVNVRGSSTGPIDSQ